MPIDYIKCQLNREVIKHIQHHPLLEFHSRLNERTGELSTTKEAKYKGLTFTIRINRIWISGSLHYFFNDDKHNFNDFDCFQLRYVLQELTSLFNIKLEECKLENLEVGVNIRLPFKSSLLLNNMLYHEVRKFNDEKVKKGKGGYRVVTHDRYMLKSYDKALQFSLPHELWRFEIHYNRMIELKKFGIIYLSDLRDKSKLLSLKAELLRRFDEVFIYDWTININAIKRPPKDMYKMQLVQYWVEEMDKNNRLKRKKIYNQIVEDYSDNVKASIGLMIAQKLDELLEVKRRPFHNRKQETKKATISQFSYRMN